MTDCDVLCARSRKNLQGVHPDLVRVIEAAAEKCDVPMVVTEGLRTQERQKELKAAGKSWTLNSRHITGHAVDIADGDNFGYDAPDMDQIAVAMKAAAEECKVPIVWGGDWKSKDTPHFELDRKAYPASGVSISTQVAETAGTIAKARITIGTTMAAGGAVVGEVATQGVPPVPEVVTKSVEHVGAWRGIGKTVWGLGSELAIVPWWMLAGGVAGLGVLAFLRWRDSRG